ncbi:S-layer homology domain-containing protein [Ferdinandcohnia quinoae]|uniref:S-layer homology domain-containing protein n=1 Tax=Fredinandcohnia quinoae TaxID=2918902 RepID=A0AAW5DWT7_9BACI|nr:S-layer homology domain-containing protein [Fredinandcohnia sp. SECRCQ15]MCH1625112.1 S-layer homology domain-containing protein [Fredinandcohnia sp. SECRCQ15]
MAYQPKSYRKFLATTVTASLVATAVAPVVGNAASASDFKDVSSKYKEAVNYLVSNNITSGLTDTSFGTDKQIKRGDAAVFIAKALGLAPVANGPFKDVNDRVAGYVNALSAAKIINGKSETKFAPDDVITRQEMALVLKNAYGLTGDVALPFKDVNSNWAPAVKALLANGITSGTSETTFGSTAPIKRGDFAIFLHRAATLKAEVSSVTATGPKTLTISGTALNKLKAEDVTVEGNKVVSLTPAAGGKTATVALETPLVEGQDYKVSVKLEDGTKEFTVKFTFVLADVAITTSSLEANKDQQFLQVTLNGAVTDLTTIDSLGYDIEFQADKAVFATATPGTAVTTSATGEIDETVAATKLNESFNVKAVLTKDGKTAESKSVKVEVVSKATPAIGDIVITTSELTLTKSVISTTDSTVAVDSVESNTGNVIDKSGLSSYASSNPEVALIDAASGAITPIKAGKTTITVKAGSVVYSKEITVVSEARVATKATASTANVAPGATYTTNVAITDQFGEKVDVSDIIAANISVSEVTLHTAAVADFTNAKDGILPVNISPLATAPAGSYTVVVKDLTTLKNLGQYTVSISADNTADNYKLVVADSSKGVANLAGTTTVKLNANEFTKSGGFLQTLDSGDTAFSVESANSTIATVTPAPDASGVITVTGVKVGTTQIILKKGGVQVATATITVKNEAPIIESITWKSTTAPITVVGKLLTYKDIFTITETASGVDPIVENVKLNVTTTSKVRIDLTAVAAPVLYLDKNDDGAYVAADDEVLGTLGTKLTGSVGQTITLGADWTSNILGQATAIGDKGSFVITVTDDDTNTTVRASTTVNVDVK